MGFDCVCGDDKMCTYHQTEIQDLHRDLESKARALVRTPIPDKYAPRRDIIDGLEDSVDRLDEIRRRARRKRSYRG